MSTDLVNWIFIATNQAAATNIPVSVYTGYRQAFFRVATLPPAVPYFQLAIATVNALNANGNSFTVDSFDSSNTNYSTNGQWVAWKRKANGNILATSGLTGDTSLGNVNIYGHLYTGPGTTEAADVQIGTNGAVGDAAWNITNTGIEPGYWIGDYSILFPDVSAPTYAGLLLPSAQTNGIFRGDIVLAAGNYTTTESGAPSPDTPLVITGGVVNLWVQGSFAIPQLIFTNGGQLILYVGRTLVSGDVLNLAGNGSVNSPGYATNLAIWGLPSLTAISLSGNAGFIGAIYAPEAAFYAGGGGIHAVDSSGSLIVNSIHLDGHWNFHFDENLIAAGPRH
jgi:hypothetical protein